MSWGIPHIEVIVTWVACIVLWIISAYLLRKRAGRGILLRRLFFLTIGLLAIAFIVTIPHRHVIAKSTVVHIITSGDRVGSSPEIPSDAAVFTSVHSFLNDDISKKASEVNVHGIGLSKQEIALLDNYNLSFYPSDTIQGITKISLNEITERQEWTLSGQYQGKDVMRIFLTTPDDEIHTANLDDGSFRINSIAPTAGSYLMPISTVISSNDTITDVLPIEVLHEPVWQMLVLSSYPSFEINYLKNYWTSLGNGFALRSKVSKDKFNSSFVNGPEINLNTITSKIVAQFDFLITDILSWNQLTNQEQRAIKRGIRDQGLALLFRPANGSSTARNFQIPKYGESSSVAWKTDSDDVELTQYETSTTWNTSQMQNHTLLKFNTYGLGHIGMLTIDDTYKLILSNNDRSYQNLWSTIFSNLYRDFSPSSRLIHSNWMWSNDQAKVMLLSEQQVSSPLILNDTLILPYLNVPFLNGVSEVTLWPEQGYNTLELTSASSDKGRRLQFFAHGKGTWQAMRQYQLREFNQRAAAESKDLNSSFFTEREKYPLWWWYLLALFGFGGLWLDERVFA